MQKNEVYVLYSFLINSLFVFASSDVIWETKLKKKLRWKPLSVKQTEKLEKEFKDYHDLSPTENKIIELDNNIPVIQRTHTHTN